MNWTFWDYPTVRRAEQLAREAGLEERSARHALYGLLRIAETEGLADTRLSSQQVLDYLGGQMARGESDDPTPEVNYGADTGESRAWLQIFQPGQLGWNMFRDLGIDPGRALTELESSNDKFLGWWSDDWTLLMQMVTGHFTPVIRLLRGSDVWTKAYEWLAQREPANPRTEPLVRPAPEPVLADLIAILARMTSVVLIYWSFGLPTPIYTGKLSIFSKFHGGPMLTNPGGALACEFGHYIVRPVHQFLTGLREPRYQLDFGYASGPVKAFLDELPTKSGLSNAWLSDEALVVLQKLSSFCRSMGVDPSPLHLTWAALKCPDSLLVRALESVDMDRLEVDLERELFGQLPDGPLAVDGVQLGAKADSLGPLLELGISDWQTQAKSRVQLSRDGHVTRVGGRVLTHGNEVLLDRETRPSQVERLLGIGRQNRWTPIYGGSIKVDTDQGMVEWVSLSAD